MPELPEVETVVAGLKKTVLGRTVQGIEIFYPKIVKSDLRKLTSALSGKRIEEINRRGKNILFSLSGNKTLLAHLGMTGHLFFFSGQAKPDKHDVAVFRFKKTKGELHFHDIRKFGKLELLTNGQQPAQKLGPEPLLIGFDEFKRLLQSRTRLLKPALLDQSFLAGIGNIYADESLFEAKLHPLRKTDSLNDDELLRLFKAIKKVLTKAIKTGGSSVDNYVDVEGNPGHFQIYHKVYGKESRPCPRCGAKIKRILVGQRSTHFCPTCQRKPRKIEA